MTARRSPQVDDAAPVAAAPRTATTAPPVRLTPSGADHTDQLVTWVERLLADLDAGTLTTADR